MEVNQIGEPYVINFGKHELLSCGCEASLFCASLIPHSWMRAKKHVPATLCRCGKRYWSWSENQEYASAAPEQQRKESK